MHAIAPVVGLGRLLAAPSRLFIMHAPVVGSRHPRRGQRRHLRSGRALLVAAALLVDVDLFVLLDELDDGAVGAQDDHRQGQQKQTENWIDLVRAVIIAELGSEVGLDQRSFSLSVLIPRR